MAHSGNSFFEDDETGIGFDEVLIVDNRSGKQKIVPRHRLKSLPDSPPFDHIARIEIWHGMRSRIVAYFALSGRLVDRDVLPPRALSSSAEQGAPGAP